ncbi:S8 family serine peptidase [Planctomycetota bacterium]
MRNFLILGFLCVFILSGVVCAENSSAAGGFVGYVEDEFIVVMKEQAGELNGGLSNGYFVTGRKDLDDIGKQFKVSRIKKQFSPVKRERVVSTLRKKLSRYHKVRFENGSLAEAMEAYRKHPLVELVEPIGICQVYLEANDPTYLAGPPGQWNLWGTYGIEANTAWNTETGDPNVVVAVADTGVRYYHPDLGGDNAAWGPDSPATNGNIWVNAGEIPDNGIDDDDNGFVDDTIGWDFVSRNRGGGINCIDIDCSDVDNDPDDGEGHGTYVAGIISMITNNAYKGAGVAGGFSDGNTSGVGNGVKVMPLRIGYEANQGGTIFPIVYMDWAGEAIVYAVDQKIENNVNVVAVNCSWGSVYESGLDLAVNYALANDVMVVHAAGNSASSTPGFLGSKAGVMNVAATDISGVGAWFTNYGSWVDVAGPGVSIFSTYVDSPSYTAVLSGTSAAAPHACAIAALLESFDPSLTRFEKFNFIVNNTIPYNDAKDLGSGIMNAAKAIEAAFPLSPADFNGDRLIDMADLKVIVTNWLFGISADTVPSPQVARWKLDGNVEDSVGGNDGTINGDPEWVDGIVLGGLEFDGDDYINCGNDSSLNLSNNFSIALWLKADSGVAVLCKGTKNATQLNGAYSINYNGTDSCIFILRDNTNTAFNMISAPITAGQWTHITATFSDGDMTLYTDGSTPAATGTLATATINTNTESFVIGCETNDSYYLTGSLDDVRIYNSVLSEGDIQAIVLLSAEGDLNGDSKVDGEDFADLAGQWSPEH